MGWIEKRRNRKQRQEWEEAANPEHRLHEVYEMVKKQVADERERMRLFQRIKRLWRV